MGSLSENFGLSIDRYSEVSIDSLRDPCFGEMLIYKLCKMPIDNSRKVPPASGGRLKSQIENFLHYFIFVSENFSFAATFFTFLSETIFMKM